MTARIIAGMTFLAAMALLAYTIMDRFAVDPMIALINALPK